MQVAKRARRSRGKLADVPLSELITMSKVRRWWADRPNWVPAALLVLAIAVASGCMIWVAPYVVN